MGNVAYRKRVLTYDEKTQLFTITVPELGIEIKTDTEMSAIIEARTAVDDYVKNRSKLLLDDTYDFNNVID